MSDKPFTCRVVTRTDQAFQGEITYADVPLWDGKAGFMAQAAPFVGKLGFGALSLTPVGGTETSWFIDGGFMQMVDNELTILTTSAVPVAELDPAEVKAELAEALARTSRDAEEMERITNERNRARSKAQAAGAR